MPVKSFLKAKRKPHWDIKKEREFEAANPGPAEDKECWDYDK